MKRKIYIDGKHWDNIMQLPCVRGLNKRDEEFVVKVKVGKASTVFAVTGDAIVGKDDGSWHVERKETMAPRRLKSGNMLCPYYHKISSCLPVERCVDTEKLEFRTCEWHSHVRKFRTCEWTPDKGCFKYPKGGQQ